MRDPETPERSTRELTKSSNDEVRAQGVTRARSEAHKRWIGDEADDGACRGFD